jgi:hypothetical protein
MGYRTGLGCGQKCWEEVPSANDGDGIHLERPVCALTIGLIIQHVRALEPIVRRISHRQRERLAEIRLRRFSVRLAWFDFDCWDTRRYARAAGTGSLSRCCQHGTLK